MEVAMSRRHRAAPAARLALAALALSLFAAAPARADSPCADDARRLCPDVPVGEGRILACLRARWKDVSSACQQNVNEVAGRARQFAAACEGDVWAFCQGVRRGQGRIAACLGARWDDLSSTCRDAVAEASEKVQRFASDCADDAARFCAGVQPGGGRIFACLKLQESRLSSRCRAAMKP
jgi:hypothetical protein